MKKHRQGVLVLVFASVAALSYGFASGTVIPSSRGARPALEETTAKPGIGGRTPDLFYLATIPGISARKHMRVIDTRPQALCEKASLPGAVCLSPRDLFGPGGRLAAFADIRWLLGALGLDGSEDALVIGNGATARDIVAGALYLAGQRRIGIVSAPVSPAWLGEGGSTRSITRDVVYTATMRDRAIITHNELRRLIASDSPPPLIDGRDEAPYWGKPTVAGRGGHIPGADNLPGATAILSGPRAPILTMRTPLIVYGDGPAQGLALLTRFEGALKPPRGERQSNPIAVYLDGWRRWAADPAVAVDAAGYGVQPCACEHGRNPT